MLSTYDLNDALSKTEILRKNAAELGYTAITMVGEHSERVGEDGVDEVKDGVTPDGVEYSWNKSNRIGRSKKCH